MNRSPETLKAYGKALQIYARLVGNRELSAETCVIVLQKMKDLNPSTQALYRSVVRGFYADALSVFMTEIKRAEKKWGRMHSLRLIKFDWEAIEYVIGYAHEPKFVSSIR